MRTDQPRTIYLKDYRVPDYLIDRTDLRFELSEEGALVQARLSIRRNPKSDRSGAPLVLHGQDFELRGVSIDERELGAGEYQQTGETLTIESVPEQFWLSCQTWLKPQDNTCLEGLYKSSGMFCTQCEAEGFRRITYYLDRPDVLARFTTTIIADAKAYPILLSNGNPIASGDTDDGRHWVTWDDPYPKPCYLFALVAGDLQHVEDSFTTASGRQVTLRIYVAPEHIEQCDFAMDSLKRAMRWDEDVYGREYDLDIFNIVAVSDFNMGAMENKGLNIFNSSCVLAHPKSATDGAFQRVEAVVAHEYFHNWSGNRVTCRDWFQLSLKEGFTVFRDAEFSADMGSRDVKRIEDAKLLQTVQFAEDSGPLAHPIRPDSYMEIANFYTVTIYEKGAEVVRMLHTLLGPEQFRAGSDRYFYQFDGQAVTTDDFVDALQAETDLDLSQFRRWYQQAGTPSLDVSDHYDETDGRYSLTVRQSCPATPGQSSKQPLLIPLTMGLLSPDGGEIELKLKADSGSGSHTKSTEMVLNCSQPEQTFEFEGVGERPIPSLLRGFSAPVRLDYPYSTEQLAFLMANDSDGFNRWNAGFTMVTRAIMQLVELHPTGHNPSTSASQLPEPMWQAFGSLLENALGGDCDPALLAKLLEMPSMAYLCEIQMDVDLDSTYSALQTFMGMIADRFSDQLIGIYQRYHSHEPYQYSAEAVASRSLKNSCLYYLLKIDNETGLKNAMQQFDQTDNMTDEYGALMAVVNSGFEQERQLLLEQFYMKWRHDGLVMDQWFSVQAASAQAGSLAQVEALMQHELFDRRNPNKVRAVIGAFCSQNYKHFHAPDGRGYEFLHRQLVELDRQNPQIAARLAIPLTRWRKYDDARQQLILKVLKQLQAQPDLSKDLYEVVAKSLS